MQTAPTFYDSLAQWSEIIGGFAFIIVAFLMFRKWGIPAVRSAQVASNADLTAAEGRREALKAEVVKARADVEAADHEARTIHERAAGDAARERERLVADARADGERVVANAENELNRARATAQADLRREFIERALTLARRQADTRIDATVNARLVGATVATLVGDGARSSTHGE